MLLGKRLQDVKTDHIVCVRVLELNSILDSACLEAGLSVGSTLYWARPHLIGVISLIVSWVAQ
jgi:hypothetical protein